MKFVARLSLIGLAVFFVFNSVGAKHALADSFQLSGIVTDSTGTVISGATIDVVNPSNGIIVASTTSDNGGNYAISVDEGTYNVQATPPPSSIFGPVIALNRTISTNTVLNFVLVSTSYVTLSGQVLTPQGQPASDVEVKLTGGPSNTQTGFTTGANGTYSLNVTPGTYRISLNASNSENLPVGRSFYLETASGAFSLAQSTILDFILPTKQLNVHVQNSSSNPVSGAHVVASMTNLVPLAGSFTIAPGITASGRNTGSNKHTNVSGDVTLEVLPFGSANPFILTANPPTGSGLASTSVNNIIVTDNLSLTITIPTPVTLSGQVLTPQGLPASDVYVGLIGPSNNKTEVYTGSDGTYSLNAVPGTYRISLDARNVDTTPVGRSFYLETPNNFSLTQNTVLNFTLPTKQVDIHVQSGSGNPVSNVSVSANVTTPSPFSGSFTIAPGITASGRNTGPTRYTNASGNVSLAVLPFGSANPYILTANPPTGSGFAITVVPNFVVTNDSSQTIILSAPVTLSGQVLTPQGQPASDVEVALTGGPSNAKTAVTTGANGTYSLNVLSGTYRISLDAKALDTQPVTRGFYLETPNNFSLSQNTVLDFTLPTKQVDIHIQDSVGNPINGVNVTVNPTTTALSGSFTIAPGITAMGRTPGTANLTKGAGDIVFAVLPFGSTNPYSLIATPPNGSIYSSFILNNIVVTTDQSNVISLQYAHARPITTAILAPDANTLGFYADPTTVTLSATTASGFTIANTYYTVDGVTQQTYSAPFVISDSGPHTITFWSIDNSGVPEAPNSQTFTIAPPLITTTSLPATTVSASYTQTLQATGGTSPLTWSVSLGTLPSGLTLNSSTGEISGISTTAGSYDFTIQVTDANNQPSTQDLTIVVNPVPVIDTISLTEGTVSGSYSQTLASTGGTAPLDWSVSSGSLPSGLLINSSTGEISGTPTATETSTFTITLTDINDISANQTLSLTVNAAPGITTTTLAVGTVGGSYSQTVAVTGGTTPLSWAVSSGSLPAGLSINSATGEISGSPSVSGNSNFNIQITDANGVSDTQSLSITINPAPTITTSGNLADATVNVAYSQTLTASGGTSPLSWSVVSGSLPPGLTMSSNGAVSGTPTATGTYNFMVQVTDSNNQSATAAQSIIVNPAPIIDTTSLQNATLNGAYSQPLVVSGGTAPFTWSLVSGSLPSGLSLNSAGVISGTPISPGNYAFTVQVIDSYGVSASQALTLMVNQAPTIVRNSLPDKKVGQNYSQSVIVTGGASPLTWSIVSGSLPDGLSLDSATGVISGIPTLVGSYTFTVQVTDANGVSDSKGYTIEINP